MLIEQIWGWFLEAAYSITAQIRNAVYVRYTFFVKKYASGYLLKIAS